MRLPAWLLPALAALAPAWLAASWPTSAEPAEPTGPPKAPEPAFQWPAVSYEGKVVSPAWLEAAYRKNASRIAVRRGGAPLQHLDKPILASGSVPHIVKVDGPSTRGFYDCHLPDKTRLIVRVEAPDTPRPGDFLLIHKGESKEPPLGVLIEPIPITREQFAAALNHRILLAWRGECPRCNGRGNVLTRQPTPEEWSKGVRIPRKRCPECKGKGKYEVDMEP